VTVPRVSIVVPTHERRDSVLRLLAALGGQTAASDVFEVVIVIDGSTDGTQEAVNTQAAAFRLRSVSQPQRGRAAACNAGARVATGDVLVFLDDDMEPLAGFVAAHLDAHASGAAIGIVGAAPIVVAADAPPLVTYRAAGFTKKLARLAQRRDDLAFTDVYTGNFSIRRDLFTAVGGYDEEFRLYGHEDYELVLRLGQLGVRFQFDAAAVARQHYTKDFRGLAANVSAEGHTAVLFALKHPDVVAVLPLNKYAKRSRRRRTMLAAFLTLGRAYRGFPSRAIALIERLERRSAPSAYPALFARYGLVFDVLYWLGVEQALHDRGMPRRRVPFHQVERWITAARQREAARTGAPRTSA